MTVSLTAGTYRISGTTYTSSAQDVTISAAHATLTRQDLISMSSSGTATITAGTPAAAPGSGVNYADPPDLPSGHIPIALVEVAAGVTSILDARIVDIRSIIPLARDLIDAKGDLLVGTAADTIARHAAGADGTVLGFDSTQSDGLANLARAGTAEIADIAATEAAGSNTKVPYADHVHAHPVFTTGDLHTNYPTQTEFDDHSARHDAGGADALAADAAAGTASLRSLGTTATTAAAGNHTTPAATATTAGHVPTPPNNTTTFLRGDATFAAPVRFIGDVPHEAGIGPSAIDPAALDAQTMQAAQSLAGDPHDAVGQVIAPAALEADLIPFSTLYDGRLFGVHSIGAVDGAARNWRSRAWPPREAIGMRQQGVTVDPPSLAAQTLGTTTVAMPFGISPGANDLVFAMPPSALEADLIPCQVYVSAGALRFSFHSIGAVDGAARTWIVYVLPSPPTVDVAVDPPSLAAQTATKVQVTVTGATTKDVVFAIPPSDLEADLIYCGCYVSAADTVQLSLHSIAAVDGASKTWKFVIFRGLLAA